MAGKNNKIQRALRFLMAKENRLGAIILCLGVVAIIVVAFMALSRWSGGSSVERFYAQEETIKKPPAYVQPVESSKPKYRRQENITPQQIIGAWEVQTEKGRGLLQLNNGAYKFALIQENAAVANIYSMGNYRLQNDLMIFEPNTNRAERQREFQGYRMLTRSPFPVLVARKGRNLVFQKPDGRVNIYVPPVHPFLRLMPDELAVFNQLK